MLRFLASQKHILRNFQNWFFLSLNCQIFITLKVKIALGYFWQLFNTGVWQLRHVVYCRPYQYYYTSPPSRSASSSHCTVSQWHVLCVRCQKISSQTGFAVAAGQTAWPNINPPWWGGDAAPMSFSEMPWNTGQIALKFCRAYGASFVQLLAKIRWRPLLPGC